MASLKKCKGFDCPQKVRSMHDLCKACVKDLPHAVRQRFFETYKNGAPGEYTEALKIAMATLKNKREKEKD